MELKIQRQINSNHPIWRREKKRLHLEKKIRDAEGSKEQ